jgi:hypothetical protein
MHRIVLVILVLAMLLVCLALDAKRGSRPRPALEPLQGAPSLGVES